MSFEEVKNDKGQIGNAVDKPNKKSTRKDKTKEIGRNIFNTHHTQKKCPQTKAAGNNETTTKTITNSTRNSNNMYDKALGFRKEATVRKIKEN